MNTLHQRIKHARKTAGLSQEAVGAACDPPISKAAVGMWESNDASKRTQPKLENLRTLASLTGFSMGYFLNGETIQSQQIKYISPDEGRKNSLIDAIDYVLANQLAETYATITNQERIALVLDLNELFHEDQAVLDNIKLLQAGTIKRFIKKI